MRILNSTIFFFLFAASVCKSSSNHTNIFIEWLANKNPKDVVQALSSLSLEFVNKETCESNRNFGYTTKYIKDSTTIQGFVGGPRGTNFADIDLHDLLQVTNFQCPLERFEYWGMSVYKGVVCVRDLRVASKGNVGFIPLEKELKGMTAELIHACALSKGFKEEEVWDKLNHCAKFGDKQTLKSFSFHMTGAGKKLDRYKKSEKGSIDAAYHLNEFCKHIALKENAPRMSTNCELCNVKSDGSKLGFESLALLTLLGAILKIA